MLSVARWIFFAAFLAALAWAVAAPAYDSIAAVLAGLAALASSFLTKKEKPSSSQVQNVSSGVGIQSGGDVKIGKLD
jgi:uncharacterized membrane-anchored protein